MSRLLDSIERAEHASKQGRAAPAKTTLDSGTNVASSRAEPRSAPHPDAILEKASNPVHEPPANGNADSSETTILRAIALLEEQIATANAQTETEHRAEVAVSARTEAERELLVKADAVRDAENAMEAAAVLRAQADAIAATVASERKEAERLATE